MRLSRVRIGALTSLTGALVSRQWRTPTHHSSQCEMDEDCGVHFEQGQVLTNWSSTHTSHPRRVYEPKSAQEVVRVLQLHHRDSGKVRPVGTALSPNGIGLCGASPNSNLVSLAHIDFVEVNPQARTVTVGAGARVSAVLAELAKHGLTLANFSSIQEQQIGGWTQVSAHGTGITLPPVDEMILRLQLATPTEGLLTLSRAANQGDDWLFRFAKVGLGSLGVVTELTLSAIPKFNLEEETFCLTRDSVGRDHVERLQKYRHVRYMWIPYTDTVVVVVSNATTKAVHDTVRGSGAAAGEKPTQAMCALLQAKAQLTPSSTQPSSSSSSSISKKSASVDYSSWSFSQLRDALLDHSPLDIGHIKAVNAAEAAYWRSSSGTRVDDSTNILGFDCGGEQLVYEVCVGMGPLGGGAGAAAGPTASVADSYDIALVKSMLSALEAANIPAPSPIEQRWTASSSAPMSPAYSPSRADVFTWVGVIMYLPQTQTQEQRAAIASKFGQYCAALQPVLDRHGAKVHWAKIEPTYSPGSPGDEGDRTAMRARLARSYKLEEFNSLRDALDPRRVLSNSLIDGLLDQEGQQ